MQMHHTTQHARTRHTDGGGSRRGAARPASRRPHAVRLLALARAGPLTCRGDSHRRLGNLCHRYDQGGVPRAGRMSCLESGTPRPAGRNRCSLSGFCCCYTSRQQNTQKNIAAAALMCALNRAAPPPRLGRRRRALWRWRAGAPPIEGLPAGRAPARTRAPSPRRLAVGGTHAQGQARREGASEGALSPHTRTVYAPMRLCTPKYGSESSVCESGESIGMV